MKFFKLFRVIRYVRKWGLRRSLNTLRHLPAYVRFYARLLADSRVPAWPKLFLLGVALYVVSPFDVAPDFIPFLGELDDFALIALAMNRLLSACPPAVRQELEAASGIPNVVFA